MKPLISIILAVVFILSSLAGLSGCQSLEKSTLKGTLKRDYDNLPAFSREEFDEDVAALLSLHENLKQIGVVFLHEVDPTKGNSKRTRCDTGLYTTQYLNAELENRPDAIELTPTDISDETPPISIEDLIRGMKKKSNWLYEHAAILEAFNEDIMTFTNKYGHGAFVIVEKDGKKTQEVFPIAALSSYETEREFAVELAHLLKEVGDHCKDAKFEDNDRMMSDVEIGKQDSCRLKVSHLISRMNGDPSVPENADTP